MIYSFSLAQVSVWVGLGLILSHGWGLFDHRQSAQWALRLEGAWQLQQLLRAAMESQSMPEAGGR